MNSKSEKREVTTPMLTPDTERRRAWPAAQAKRETFMLFHGFDFELGDHYCLTKVRIKIPYTSSIFNLFNGWHISC